MELDSKTLYQANPNFLMREIGGESVLVPVGDADVFENSMLSLNASCSFLWKQFQNPCTVRKAADAAMEEFSAPAEIIEADVKRFVEEYVEYNLLQEC